MINVITKQFTDETGGAVAVAFDDEDGRHASAHLRGEARGNHLVVYGSVDDGEGISQFRDEDYQPSTTDRRRGYDVKSGGFKFLRDFSDTVRFSTTYQHTDADIELLRAMQIASNVNSRDEDLISAKLDMKLGEKVDFYVKGYYHDWDTRYTTILNSLSNPGTTVVDADGLYWGFNDYGLNALMRLKLNKGFEYFVGYDTQKYGGRDEVLLIADNHEQTDAWFRADPHHR